MPKKDHSHDYSIIFDNLIEDEPATIDLEIAETIDEVQRLKQIVEDFSDSQEPLTYTRS